MAEKTAREGRGEAVRLLNLAWQGNCSPNKVGQNSGVFVP